jgi:hypothetical protein
VFLQLLLNTIREPSPSKLHKLLHEHPQLPPNLLIDDLAILIDDIASPRYPQPPLAPEIRPQRAQHWQPRVLTKNGPEPAGGRTNQRHRPSMENADHAVSNPTASARHCVSTACQ